MTNKELVSFLSKISDVTEVNKGYCDLRCPLRNACENDECMITDEEGTLGLVIAGI